MHRRHVCGRRRRELGTHRCHFETFDQRMIAMALQELEPERIEEDQGDALVTVDAASHLGRDIGEVLHAAHCCRSLLGRPGEEPARVNAFSLLASRSRAARRRPKRASYQGRDSPAREARSMGDDSWRERRQPTLDLAAPRAGRGETLSPATSTRPSRRSSPPSAGISAAPASRSTLARASSAPPPRTR